MEYLLLVSSLLAGRGLIVDYHMPVAGFPIVNMDVVFSSAAST
jgi:hypothetical protein